MVTPKLSDPALLRSVLYQCGVQFLREFRDVHATTRHKRYKFAGIPPLTPFTEARIALLLESTFGKRLIKAEIRRTDKLERTPRHYMSYVVTLEPVVQN